MYFKKFTTLTTPALFQELNTKESGLCQADATERLQKIGLNQASGNELHWWEVLLRQYKSPFIYVLLIAAVLSFFLGEKIDSIIIIVIVLLNTLLSFIQEFRSEKALQLLKKLLIGRAKVIRDGVEKEILAKEIVPGDIVVIETGDIIPADLRLIKVNGLVVDESTLTGESINVNKTDKPITETGEIYKAENIGFGGAKVVSGQGTGVCVGTGKNSVAGEMTRLTVETEKFGLLEKGITKFSKFILILTIVTLALVVVANLLIKGSNANIFELLLFAIALAVGVIPEALPIVTTLSLSHGAADLAKEHVIVKRLSAVEDIGGLDVLCTDKTGTITENKMKVENIHSAEPKKTLFYAGLGSTFLGEKLTDTGNSFDQAIWNKTSDNSKTELTNWKKLAEIPFSPDRRRGSALVAHGAEKHLIVRGALEFVAPLCANLSDEKLAELKKWQHEQGQEGHRLLAIASKPFTNNNYGAEDEQGLQFIGLIAFLDPIKHTTRAAIRQARHLGVQIKILTGDSPEVAGAVARKVGIVKKTDDVITGEALESLDIDQRVAAVNKHAVFARVSPQQKFMIIELLQRNFEVGFLGEGINDAPALKLAHVGLVVDKASDIARDAADIILLKSDLNVIIDGIKRGRKIFANTVKYLKTTLISNFGNFFAVAAASLFVNYLPMLTVQILLLNLLSDTPMISITADSVDDVELRHPKTYDVKSVVIMAVVLGSISTVFDFIFFAIFMKHSPGIVQTSWFIASVLTEIALIYSIRTRRFFLRGKKTNRYVIVPTAIAVALALILPFTSFGQTVFHFVAPEAIHLVTILAIVVCYFVISEGMKLAYYRVAKK